LPAGVARLHSIGGCVSGLLGDHPAVLAGQAGQQAQNERPGPASRLDPAEPPPDARHQLIEQTQPPGWVHAAASGHREIIKSRHNPR
jgi:hypothetical protein